MSILKRFVIGVAIVVIAWPMHGAASAQTPATELKVVKTFQVGGQGGFDYPLVDAASHRLYLSRATRVMVLDLDQGTVQGEIGELQGSHGIAIAPQHKLGFATSGRDNSVVVFDVNSLKTVKRISTGKNPDAILYDPASQKIFAFCHSGGDAAIIDPSNLDAAPVSLPLGAKLEFGVADGAGHVYVNDEDKNETIAIDSKLQKVLAHWSLLPAEAPTGLALDAAHHRLYAGCGNKKMAVLDAETGKVLGTPDIGDGVDGVIYDPQLGALSANGKDGTVSVVREAGGEFKTVQTLPTAKSGKTITCDTTTHRAYVPANIPGENGAPAQFGVVVIGLGQ